MGRAAVEAKAALTAGVPAKAMPRAAVEAKAAQTAAVPAPKKNPKVWVPRGSAATEAHQCFPKGAWARKACPKIPEVAKSGSRAAVAAKTDQHSVPGAKRSAQPVSGTGSETARAAVAAKRTPAVAVAARRTPATAVAVPSVVLRRRPAEGDGSMCLLNWGDQVAEHNLDLLPWNGVGAGWVAAERWCERRPVSKFATQVAHARCRGGGRFFVLAAVARVDSLRASEEVHTTLDYEVMAVEIKFRLPWLGRDHLRVLVLRLGRRELPNPAAVAAACGHLMREEMHTALCVLSGPRSWRAALAWEASDQWVAGGGCFVRCWDVEAAVAAEAPGAPGAAPKWGPLVVIATARGVNPKAMSRNQWRMKSVPGGGVILRDYLRQKRSVAAQLRRRGGGQGGRGGGQGGRGGGLSSRGGGPSQGDRGGNKRARGPERWSPRGPRTHSESEEETVSPSPSPSATEGDSEEEMVGVLRPRWRPGQAGGRRQPWRR